MYKHIVTFLALTACGAEAPVAPVATPTAEQPAPAAPVAPAVGEEVPDSQPAGGIRLLAAGAKLPSCTADLEGITYYVADADEFRACAAKVWAVVDLNGKDGAAGAAGKDGADGKDGSDGERGEKGEQGDLGAAGANGAAGAAGQDAHALRVVSGSEYVGDFYGYYTTTRMFVAHGGMRFEIDAVQGTLSTAYVVYSLPGCAGAARIVMGVGNGSGNFANTFSRPTMGDFVKGIGNNLGAYTHASRRTSNNACDTVTGNVTASWEFETVTLPFAYPVVKPEIAN